jgi:DNA repair protein RadC
MKQAENDNWHVAELKIKYDKRINPRLKISCCYDAYRVITYSISDIDNLDLQEHCYAVFLNRSANILGFKLINTGKLEEIRINTRLIFSSAFLLNATGFIIAHNHPSENLTPSKSDINFTESLKKASEILDLDMVDHIIFSKKGYTSIRNEGYINWSKDGHYNRYAFNIQDKGSKARRIQRRKPVEQTDTKISNIESLNNFQLRSEYEILFYESIKNVKLLNKDYQSEIRSSSLDKITDNQKAFENLLFSANFDIQKVDTKQLEKVVLSQKNINEEILKHTTKNIFKNEKNI